MNIDTKILQKVTQMPESLKQELRPYAEELMENYSKDISLKKNSVKKNVVQVSLKERLFDHIYFSVKSSISL